MDNKRTQLILAAAAVVLLAALDQITKKAAESLVSAPYILLPGVFEFRYFENHGAAFSMLQNRFTLFYIGTALIMGVIIYAMIRVPATRRYRPMRIVMIFVAAGAIGNLIDRISFHYVRDFLYFSLIDFPIFNVADMYVTCGAFAFAFLVLFYYKDEEFSFLKRTGKKEK